MATKSERRAPTPLHGFKVIPNILWFAPVPLLAESIKIKGLYLANQHPQGIKPPPLYLDSLVTDEIFALFEGVESPSLYHHN